LFDIEVILKLSVVLENFTYPCKILAEFFFKSLMPKKWYIRILCLVLLHVFKVRVIKVSFNKIH
jgi:hypothetical protein